MKGSLRRGALLLGLAVAGLPAAPAEKAGTSKSTNDTALAASQGEAADTPAKPKSRADTVVVPRHDFDHREQIITGSVVMSCLLLILAAMNNYNPR